MPDGRFFKISLSEWIVSFDRFPEGLQNQSGQYRIVSKAHIPVPRGEQIELIEVSCVFLSTDHGAYHNFNHDDKFPILWECMVFGGKLHEFQERTSGTKFHAQALFIRTLRYVLKVELDREDVSLIQLRKEFRLEWMDSPTWKRIIKKEMSNGYKKGQGCPI